MPACRALIAGLLGALGLAGQLLSYAYAQEGDTAVLQGGAGEFYLAGLPPGWTKRTEAGDRLGHHGDWLPEGQTLAKWRDRLTLQVVPDLAERTPRDVLDQMANLRAEACERMLATDVEEATLNGYAVGFRVIACTRDKRTGVGEMLAVRALSGGQALYVVQRTFRVAPFTPGDFPVDGEALDRARAAIEYGFACQMASLERPCPAEWHELLGTLDPARPLVVFPAE